MGIAPLALALLAAVDDGAPAAAPARTLAVAVLAAEAPGSARWERALDVLEGGTLRTRWAVMLAGEVLGEPYVSGAETASRAVTG